MMGCNALEKRKSVMKICFVIPSLEPNGIARQMATLARTLRRRGVRVQVAVFHEGGALQESLLQERVKILRLHKRGWWDYPRLFIDLYKWVRREKPDVLNGYLTGANLLCAFVGILFRHVRVVWTLGGALLPHDRETIRVLESPVLRFFQFLPNLILTNTKTAFAHHVDSGFKENKMLIVPNGVDAAEFKPHPRRKKPMRRAWGVGEDEIVIGRIARLDSTKGVETVLTALSLLPKRKFGKIRCVFVGDATWEALEKFEAYAEDLGVRSQVIFAGYTAAVSSAYAAFDLSVSPSISDSFPNSVAESMACGIPVVAADAGESVWVVGEKECLFAAQDAKALAGAIESFLTLSIAKKKTIGKEARQRIVSHFSLNRLTNSYLESVCPDKAASFLVSDSEEEQ